jgi:hypothetical protein
MKEPVFVWGSIGITRRREDNCDSVRWKGALAENVFAISLLERSTGSHSKPTKDGSILLALTPDAVLMIP